MKKVLIILMMLLTLTTGCGSLGSANHCLDGTKWKADVMGETITLEFKDGKSIFNGVGRLDYYCGKDGEIILKRDTVEYILKVKGDTLIGKDDSGMMEITYKKVKNLI